MSSFEAKTFKIANENENEEKKRKKSMKRNANAQQQHTKIYSNNFAQPITSTNCSSFELLDKYYTPNE